MYFKMSSLCDRDFWDYVDCVLVHHKITADVVCLVEEVTWMVKFELVSLHECERRLVVFQL